MKNSTPRRRREGKNPSTLHGEGGISDATHWIIVVQSESFLDNFTFLYNFIMILGKGVAVLVFTMVAIALFFSFFTLQFFEGPNKVFS